jgi:hypothetical protein
MRIFYFCAQIDMVIISISSPAKRGLPSLHAADRPTSDIVAIDSVAAAA